MSQSAIAVESLSKGYVVERGESIRTFRVTVSSLNIAFADRAP
jgi:hypothetical protein